MLGIGMGELLLVAILAIIFFKPEDLPKVFRNIAKVYRQLFSLKEEMRFQISSMEMTEQKPPEALKAENEAGDEL